jgi:PGF-pre-PGF domain-containing protein/PGF-CTERM protein
VKFTDASQYAAAWDWNFGDGGTSTEQSPTYVFNSEGTFNVNLTVSNANGTSSKLAAITVFSSSSSGSSSGGSSGSSGGSGGGGGAGGSPEPQNNVEIKELSQTSIFASQPVKFEFPQKVTAVESITFNSKKTVGKTTTIAEMLKNQSTLVSGKPSDEVYKYLNIWVGSGGYATPKNIENAVVTFKVAKSWVQDNKIDKSSITLRRYDNKTWNQLSTTLSSEDDTYLKFTAQTPGFSPFAITGKSTAIQPAAGDKTQPATVSQTQNNSGNGSATNTNKTPEQKGSPGSSTKPGTSIPGFEAVIGVAGLVAVFLYRRK